MRFKSGLIAPLAMVVFLVAIVACGEDSTATAAPAGLNTPDIQATVTALALSQAQALTPTPVPEGVRQELVAFAAGHRSASDDWDRFHQGIEQWQNEVVACLPSSFESALDTFAGRALGITQTARSLDRLPFLDAFAARLTAGAEQEEAAFGALSSNWRPESGLSAEESSRVSELFQRVAAVRSAVDQERGSVTRALLARQTSVDGPNLEAVESFASGLEIVESDWDEFHREYDAFRVEQVELGDEAAATRLGGLLTQFGSIVDGIQSLPDTLLTREIADRLADAADGEQLLLRRLLGAIGDDAALIEMVPVLPDGLVITETANGESVSSGLALSNATVFDVFDTQIALVNRLRRALRNDFSDARASLTASGQEDLGVFLEQTTALERRWDEFHGSYDDWRRNNGGCNQGLALEKLGQLANEFSQTARAVRELPSSPLVRGIGNLLLQAVEREQAAVSSLRESWRALDTSAFRRYSAERSFAETLRRQVALELRDLLARQGISRGG